VTWALAGSTTGSGFKTQFLEKTLNLNDVVLEDKNTQTSEDYANDEVDPSTRYCV
jgi:hypothetical protein